VAGLTFNIIYIRDTAGPLSRFVPTLVDGADWCSYRLVSNGCPPPEEQILQQVADDLPGVTFASLNSPVVLTHGNALSTLAASYDDGDFFAVMDSDIIADGNFGARLLQWLENHDAVFSASPLWARDVDQVLPDDATEVAGPHVRTPAGICLGNSYFAVYRRAALHRVMAAAAVTLDKYTDLRTCASGFRDYLARYRLARADYVPTKLLNLGFSYLGLPIAHFDCPELLHIGGFSMATYAQAAERAHTAGAATQPAETVATMLDYSDHRPYMSRKQAVCDRLMMSFAAIDRGDRPDRTIQFRDQLEAQLRRVEELYAHQAWRDALPTRH
jgi:hypothetical protein